MARTNNASFSVVIRGAITGSGAVRQPGIEKWGRGGVAGGCWEAGGILDGNSPKHAHEGLAEKSAHPIIAARTKGKRRERAERERKQPDATKPMIKLPKRNQRGRPKPRRHAGESPQRQKQKTMPKRG